MADKKISELDAITGANTAATDVFVVVDTSTGQTKKITREELNNAIEQDVLSSIDIDTINGDFTVNGNINLGDDDKAIFGASSDLQIYHDGTYNFINAASGQFIFMQADELRLRSSTGETYFASTLNGATSLYHDASLKLSTTSTGVDITGALTVSGDLTVNGTTTTINSTTLTIDDKNIVLASGAADAAAANGAGITIDGADATITYNSISDKFQFTNGIKVADGVQIVLGDAGDLKLYHTGSDSVIQDAGQGDLYVKASNNLWFQGNTSNDIMARFQDNGAVTLYYDNAAKLATTSTGIDVTGTVTADGLTVDGTTSFTQKVVFDNNDELRWKDSGGTERTALYLDSSNNLNLGTSAGGNLRFINGSSYTERMRIDGSGDVNIYGTDNRPLAITSFDTVSAGAGWDLDATSGNGVVTISTGGTERMRLDSSGRLGIGSSAPDKNLVVSSSSGTEIVINDSDATPNPILRFRESGSTSSTISTSSNNLIFSVTTTERMRITSGGLIGIGTSSPGGAFHLKTIRYDSYPIFQTTSDSFTPFFINFQKTDGTTIGSIRMTGTTGVAFNTTSDYRLKENVVSLTDGIERLKQLEPKRFNFISDAGITVDGFLAHEAQTVVPQAVTGEKDAVDEDGNPEYQSIDHSKLVPLLTAALQEAIAKIEDLEERVATLEGN